MGPGETSHTAELLARIRPGMNFCSSDYRKWGEVDRVPSPDEEPVLTGHRESDGSRVDVPLSAVLELRGQKCVRLDTVIAELDERGWVRPADSRSDAETD